MNRLVLSHIDRTIFDEGRLLKLADTGCIIEFDLFGMEQSYYPHSDIDMPNDAIRLRLLRGLLDRLRCLGRRLLHLRPMPGRPRLRPQRMLGRTQLLPSRGL